MSRNVKGYEVEAKTYGKASRFISDAKVVTDTYIVQPLDSRVVGNKSTAFSITLPPAVVKMKYTISNIGEGRIILEGNGSETIDGELNQAIDQWESIDVVCYVTGSWKII